MYSVRTELHIGYAIANAQTETTRCNASVNIADAKDRFPAYSLSLAQVNSWEAEGAMQGFTDFH